VVACNHAIVRQDAARACKHAPCGLLVRCIAASCLCLSASPLFAVERSKAFVDGLRAPECAMYDVALDYLEAMRTSPLADKAFRETIDYEMGVTLLEGSRFLPPAEREGELEKARVWFQKFLVDHSQHPLATSANRRLADVLIERGAIKKELAAQPDILSTERKQLLEEARALFEEAQKSLTIVDAQLNRTQKAFGNLDPSDAAAIAERNRVRSEIILTRFALAKMLYEIAHTFDPDSQQCKESLLAAAVKYNEYYWKYERWLGSYAFRIEEARCYKELGDYAKALSILDELATSRSYDAEGVGRIRTVATDLALQTYLLPQVKKYQEAWNAYEKWENSTEQPGELDHEAMAVRYFGGQAALELARTIDRSDAGAAKQRAEYLKRAKSLLSFAASSPGEFRLKARLKLADPLLAVGEVRVETPKSFGDACDRAKLAWDRLQEGDLNLEQEKQLQAEARECYRFALAHPPSSLKTDDLNVIRYCVAYLDWAAEEYYDAAVLGEFLARCYPDRPEAQRGAEIALKSYARLCAEASVGDNRKFETDRMEAIADFITARWPRSVVADEAWMMSIRAAMSKRDTAKALECLGRIAADSPRRGDAELMTGQALWNAYLEAARLPEERQPTKAEMAEFMSEGRKALEDGVARLRKPVDEGASVSYSLPAASLALAQICLQTGNAAKAVRWLDDPKIGAHALVKANNKAIDRGNFRVEAFKTALRAYVATQQLEKAEATMNALEKSGGAGNIARIYIGLGRQLEEALKRLRAEGKQEEAAKVAHGFEFFLTRIAARPAAEATFSALYWVAETFTNLGDSLSSDGRKPSPEAVKNYGKAANTYEKIVEACRADPNFAPTAGSLTSVQIRLARCLRRLGKYEEALDTLVEVLKIRDNLLDAQREAACTYQAWGAEKPGYFVLAIRGGRKVVRKDGSSVNLVWGWGGIANRVQNVEARHDIYDEARYNLALCRFKYAQSKTGQEQADELRKAAQEILIVQRIRPEMGGQKWYDQYDALLRKIQKDLGVKEEKQGLKAAEQPFTGRQS
jgi:cellulose synthase operon protein C